MTTKEQIIATATEWVDKQIDTIVSAKPNMFVFSGRAKQAFQNIIVQNESKLDNALLFLTDKEGKLDITDMFDETLRVFEEAPITHKSMYGFDLSIGKGAIELKTPSNYLINMFMGETNSFKWTTADFTELKEMFIASQTK